jgi:hypothetical protein
LIPAFKNQMHHNSGAAWMETITNPTRKTASQRTDWRR